MPLWLSFGVSKNLVLLNCSGFKRIEEASTLIVLLVILLNFKLFSYLICLNVLKNSLLIDLFVSILILLLSSNPEYLSILLFQNFNSLLLTILEGGLLILLYNCKFSSDILNWWLFYLKGLFIDLAMIKGFLLLFLKRSEYSIKLIDLLIFVEFYLLEDYSS